MGDFMKSSLGMSAEQVLAQNTKIMILTAIGSAIVICFMKKYHPIKIAKTNVALFVMALPFIPYLLNNNLGTFSLSCVQLAMCSLTVSAFGIEVACFKHLPITKRFSFLATLFGLSGALAFTVSSFGLAPLIDCYGYYALWIVYIPIVIGLMFSINYLQKLEAKNGSYNDYPNEDGASENDEFQEEDSYYILGKKNL
jgi:hypothetical protein